MGNPRTITSATEFWFEDGTLMVKATLVFHNPVQRLAASFFLGVNKPAGDIRLFSGFEEAREWLKE